MGSTASPISVEPNAARALTLTRTQAAPSPHGSSNAWSKSGPLLRRTVAVEALCRPTRTVQYASTGPARSGCRSPRARQIVPRTMFGSPPPAASSSESSSGKSSSASTKYASSSRTSPQARPSASSSGNQSSCSTPTAWKHVRRLITQRPSAWSRAADRALCMTATTTSSAASATSVKIIVLAFHSGADVAEATAVRSSSAPHCTSANGLQSPPSTSPSPRAATTLTSNRSLTSPIFRNLYAGLGGPAGSTSLRTGPPSELGSPARPATVDTYATLSWRRPPRTPFGTLPGGVDGYALPRR